MKAFNPVRLILFFAAVLFLGGSAFAQQDTLTIEKCIDIALKNNPQLRIAENSYELSSSNLTGVRSVLFPQISLQSNYAKNGGTFFFGPTARPADYENYAVGFQAQQLVFDFGKTFSRVSATADLKDASLQDLISAKQNLILSTYLAYFSYLQAERIQKVNLESLLQAKEHLDQAEKFYEVGKKPQFDVLKAKTDEANAKVNLITSQNNLIISKLQLENVLNTKLGDNFQLRDNLELSKDTVSLDNALKISYLNRPELIGSKYRVEANKSFVTAVWTANLPTISATGGYTWRGYALNQNFLNSWNVGLSFSLPLFQGFALDAGIDQAKANLNIAEAQYDYSLQTVNLDVQQQYASVKLALAKIDATKSLVQQAEEAFKLAEARYKEEVGSPIEITDARVTLLNAQTIYIQSLYDYQVANVRLQKAMGILK
ncbi:MAG: TolC family protein [Bacteroidetes bacterium]|nr:TolC family protein [Bacteroidota bacterium]